MTEQQSALIEHLQNRFEAGEGSYLSSEEVGMLLEMLHPPVPVKRDEETKQESVLSVSTVLQTGNLFPMGRMWHEEFSIPYYWNPDVGVDIATEKDSTVVVVQQAEPEPQTQTVLSIEGLSPYTQENLSQMSEFFQKTICKPKKVRGVYDTMTGKWVKEKE